MDGSTIVKQAKKYLGENGRRFCNAYPLPWGSLWCCVFLWYVFKQAKAGKYFYGGQKVAYVPTVQAWLKANCKHVSLADAMPGDVVVFTWSGKGYNKEQGSRDHIGLIRAKGTKDVCYTIEGNTGTGDPTTSKVMNRTRELKYIYAIYRPNYDDTYKIVFKARGGLGTMKTITVSRGETVQLPKNLFKRAGFKFCGWSVGKSDYVNMDSFQIGKPKYKNNAKVKDLAKAGGKVVLYACWKGYGAEAAALWARKIAKDNTYKYGADDHANWYHKRDRAHQVGCPFCGTTITGPKKAKKGSRWEFTFCCNALVIAALTHGANLFKKCEGGSTSVAYWTKLKGPDGKPLYKKLGTNVKYSELKPGDILDKEGKHVKVFTGKSKIKGFYLVTHAAREGWDDKSIRTDRVKGRIGKEYTALRYIGR